MKSFNHCSLLQLFISIYRCIAPSSSIKLFVLIAADITVSLGNNYLYPSQSMCAEASVKVILFIFYSDIFFKLNKLLKNYCFDELHGKIQ